MCELCEQEQLFDDDFDGDLFVADSPYDIDESEPEIEYEPDFDDDESENII